MFRHPPAALGIPQHYAGSLRAVLPGESNQRGGPPPAATAAGYRDTFGVIVFAALLLLPGLAATPLLDPDEGRHAGIARWMADAGRWIRPEIYGEPYDDKPSGFYWLVRAAAVLPVAPETAARLPSALATLATAVLLHRWAFSRLGRGAAALGVAIFLTSIEVVALGRFCNLDASLSFFITAAVVAWLIFIERLDRGADAAQVGAPLATGGAATGGAATGGAATGGVALAAWLAMSLGTLVKGPVAVVLPLFVATVVSGTRGRLAETLRRARPFQGMSLLALIFGGWLLAAALADPSYPINFLLKHNLSRFGSAAFEHHQGPFYFLPVLVGGFLPWSLCLPAALSAGRAEEPGRAAVERALLLWASVVVLFFSASEAKLATYVLPAFGPLSLWLGSCLTRAGDSVASRLRVAARLYGAILAAGALGAALWFVACWPEHASLALWSIPVLVVSVLLLIRSRASAKATLARLVLANVALLGIAALGVLPGAARIASDQSLARWFLTHAPHLEIMAYKAEPASLSYYSHREIRRVASIGRLVDLAARHPIALVTRLSRVKELEEAGIVFRQRIDNGRHVLLISAEAKTSAARLRKAESDAALARSSGDLSPADPKDLAESAGEAP